MTAPPPYRRPSRRLHGIPRGFEEPLIWMRFTLAAGQKDLLREWYAPKVAGRSQGISNGIRQLIRAAELRTTDRRYVRYLPILADEPSSEIALVRVPRHQLTFLRRAYKQRSIEHRGKRPRNYALYSLAVRDLIERERLRRVESAVLDSPA